jgi:hypothetical protein
MKLLASAIDALSSRFTDAARVLEKQLVARDVRVWLSQGCLAEFAAVASAAAARTRQADESYGSSLRREMATRAQFIQEWTGSDRKFESPQAGELVAIARKYALPRAWRVVEPGASVREATNVAVIANRHVKIVQR